MISNRIGLAAFGAMVLVSSGVSAAQPYHPGEFLNLDLSRAILSPKPLGPAAGFAPGPLDVTVDRSDKAARASAELAVDPKSVATATVHAENKAIPKAEPKTVLRTAASGMRTAHGRVAERTASHRTLVALYGRNPVEAQARETTVQTWPCRSGGICNWKR
jgi:hypothetical protein